MVTELEPTPREPYVGPVPFEAKDKALFFGRENENEEILSLAIAHPVLLVYAQSGAGKTSLLNANFVPKLRQEGYEVLPVARVQGNDCDARTNIYIFNTLISWAEGRVDAQQLARMSLSDFLDRREHQKNNVDWELPRFLIFDQFEELFTAYPQRWQERKEFFEQIRDALEKDYLLRVIFAMREDYIAELDAYASILPEKLRTRFRLARPRAKAALAAVKKPLEVVQTSRRFAAGVAEKLVENLMMIPAEGGGESRLGQFVEPVQLQVVCQSLWKALEPQDQEITHQHLENCGDVNRALSDFYERCIASAVLQTGVKEGLLREWFENTLITADGSRGMVFRGPERTGTIPNNAVDVLEKLHLIKGEKRGRSRWYELAHDRFIEPIRESNGVWWGERAGAVQTRQRLEAQAREWVRKGRGREGLLDEAQLLEADRWLESPDAAELPPSETLLALVSASRAEMRERAESIRQAQMLSIEQGRRLKQQRIGLLAMVVLVIAMGVLTSYAFRQRAIAKGALAEADMQKVIAVRQRELADAAREDADRLRDVAQKQRGAAVTEAEAARKAEDLAKKAQADAMAQKAIADSARVESERQKNVAQSRELAGTAIKQVSNDPELSILLARAAVEKTYLSEGTVTESAAEALHTTIQAFRKKSSPSFGSDSFVLSEAAFTLDGTRLAGIGGDGAIRIWDNSGNVIKTLTSTVKPAYPITFSPDGKSLVSASSDRSSLLLWDVESGTVLDRTSATSKLYLFGLALSPTGKLIAWGTDRLRIDYDPNPPTEVILWDLSARKFAQSSPGSNVLPAGFEKVKIESVAFSPDGKTVAFGGEMTEEGPGFTLMLILATGKPLQTRQKIQWDDSAAVALVSFSSDGKRFAAASARGAVKVWDFPSGREAFQACSQTPPETLLAFSPDLEYSASASTGNRAKIRRLRTPVVFHEESKTEVRPEEVTLVGHTSPIMRAAFTSSSLMTISQDRSVTIWDLSSGAEVATLSGNWIGEVAGIAFSPDGKRLAAAIADNTHPTVEIWEGTRRVLTLSGHTQKVWGVVFNREGTRIATSSSDGTVKIWDAVTGDLQRTLHNSLAGVRELAINRDGTRLVTGSEDYTAKIWNVDTEKVLRTLRHQGVVWGVAFSSDGRHVATASDDKTAKVWDIESESDQPIFTMQHGGPVWKVAFSPDGKRIATASHDGTAKVWDAKTGKELLTLTVNDQLWGISFSPDGTRIATASSDKTARVWDAKSGRQLLVLTGHSSAVNRAVFSPDGRHLATSSEDRTVRLYTLDIRELISLSRERVPRLLTVMERKNYLPDR
jgi:WD40 repeat protein